MVQRLTYTGPAEILVKTPVTLAGHYDSSGITQVTLTAEDKYPFNVVQEPSQEPSQGRWQSVLDEGFYHGGPGGCDSRV
jgi:hypothetical protein